MKLLAACLLAVALVFRAAPLCAAPVVAEAAVSMPDCDHSTTDHEGDEGKKGQDMARACLSCVFPPATDVGLLQPVRWAATVPRVQPASQLNGGALEPPVPPPRLANGTSFQQFNGV